eukprot:2595218-Pyramimonas_sp.AAC.1
MGEDEEKNRSRKYNGQENNRRTVMRRSRRGLVQMANSGMRKREWQKGGLERREGTRQAYAGGEGS